MLWVSFIIIELSSAVGMELVLARAVLDPHMVEALTNVDLPYMFGFRDYLWSAIFGLVLIGGYFVVGMVLFYWWVSRRPANDPGRRSGRRA